MIRAMILAFDQAKFGYQKKETSAFQETFPTVATSDLETLSLVEKPIKSLKTTK
jgi:hypothetical protein